MSLFSYKARSKRGQLVEGMVEAISEEIVANLLSEKNLTVISIKVKSPASLKLYSLNIISRVKIKDLVIFFRQLAVMVDAQLPIVKALRILVRQTQNRNFKVVISSIANEVDGGARLSAAMQNFPDVFNRFYTNVISSGETSGQLSEVMNYLADQQEKDYYLQSKIKGAMIYPGIILGGLIIVGLVLMTFVVPQMTAILQESGIKLPLSTRLLIGLSHFFQYAWWQIIILAIILAAAGNFYIQTKKGRRLLDLFKLKIPIFGQIFKKIYIIRLTRTFATLLKGGVPVARALETVKEAVGNNLFEDILAETIRGVDEGGSVADGLALNHYLPIIVSQMVAIGEETGKLEEVLEKMTDFYAREVDNSVNNLSILLEPVVMIVLGVAVGFFVAAVIMPMWQLSAAY